MNLELPAAAERERHALVGVGCHPLDRPVALKILGSALNRDADIARLRAGHRQQAPR
jgi:hypothetical protein